MSPLLSRLLLALVFSAAVTTLGYWRGSLSASGAAAAAVVGTAVMGLGGVNWGILLALFFVTSSLLSHYKEAEKRQAADKFAKSHRRDAGQVLANGGLCVLLATLSAIFPSPVWFALCIGTLATATADTWATELGTLGGRPPRLITNGRVVEVGTSGGVSPLGTAVAAAGGALIGMVGGLLSADLSLAAGAALGLIGGLLGSTFDSFLGATAQRIYYCDQCQKETESRLHRGRHPTRPLRGWPWLNNDWVNFLASAVGALAALGLWRLLVA